MYNRRCQIFEEGNNTQIVETAKIPVHNFFVSDVDDPDIYAAEPILEWEKSTMGQWVMKHAVSTPKWYSHLNPSTYGYRYVIIAELEMPKITEFYLRWGSVKL